jgi:hypothetical protein
MSWGTRVFGKTAVVTACALAAAGGSAAATASAAAFAGERNLPAPSPASRFTAGIAQDDSYNWSGYAQTAAKGTFYSVKDTWIVPKVNTAVSGNQYSADWVGVGGFNDGTLVQAGTEADNIGGKAEYLAWTEILPEAENPLSLPVHPGDKITTSVREGKPGKWTMTVTDVTTKQKGTRTAAYAGSSHASVESIHERPCITAPCSSVSDLAKLTQTTNVTFDPGRYGTVSGGLANTPLMTLATGATLHQVFMVNNAGSAIIASPSAVDKDSDGFTLADGNVEPAPPKS